MSVSVPLDLFTEILPQIEQGYKAQVLNPPAEWDTQRVMREPIKIIVPIQKSLLTVSTEDLDAVYVRLTDVPWIYTAGPYPGPVILDDDGHVVFDLAAQDLVAIDVTCKPFRDVHLSRDRDDYYRSH